MQVIKKSSSGVQSLPLDAMLLSNRMVFLKGRITSETADEIIRQLVYLTQEDPAVPIRLIINSPGGSVSAGLALYDQIKGSPVPIETYCVELAASMAAHLLAAGAPGKRFILRHSNTMIHEPLISSEGGGISGSATDIQKTAESIMKTKRQLVELLAKDTGHTAKEIEAATAFDNIMDAEQAVAYGLCDRIIDHI